MARLTGAQKFDVCLVSGVVIAVTLAVVVSGSILFWALNLVVEVRQVLKG
jgi:hypothetical protein